MHSLPSDIPGYVESMPMTVEYCDGLLVYATCRGFGVCNPWLRQIRWMESGIGYHIYNGMGYDNSRSDSHYKIIGCHQSENIIVKASITEFGSDACKFYEFASNDWDLRWSCYSVSLNGTLYWVAYNHESHYPFIQSFDFSMERFKPFCILPSKNNHPDYARSLAVFKGDRFSFLEQDYKTGNMEIWVTKKKVENGDGEAVEWIKFMNVSVPKWSSLDVRYYPPSYFIEDKSLSLVVCCHDKNGQACIYIAKEDRFHEIEIKDLVDYHPRHCTYFPSLVPVPTNGENNTFTDFSDLILWQDEGKESRCKAKGK